MTELWLNAKKEVVFTVDYNDLNKAIQRYFGRKDYECVAANEWSNYSSYEFNVDANISAYNMDEVYKFIRGRGYGSHLTRALLCKMRVDNVIDPGKYIVKVF